MATTLGICSCLRASGRMLALVQLMVRAGGMTNFLKLIGPGIDHQMLAVLRLLSLPTPLSGTVPPLALSQSLLSHGITMRSCCELPKDTLPFPHRRIAECEAIGAAGSGRPRCLFKALAVVSWAWTGTKFNPGMFCCRSLWSQVTWF